MAIIQWIIGTAGLAERLVGANNASFTDVLNRPLQQVMQLSGVAPTDDFQGFALAGASGSFSSSYALTASYALNGGSGGSGGTVLSASYSDFALQAQYAPNYFQTAGGTITGPITLGNNLDIIIGSDTSVDGTMGLGGNLGVALLSDVSQTVILRALANLVQISGSLHVKGNVLVPNAAVTASGFFSSAPSTFTGSVSVSGSVFSRTTLRTVTASYSMSLTDQFVIVNSSAATASLALPLASVSKGLSYTIRKNDAGPAPLFINAAGSDTIDGVGIRSSSLLFDTFTITSDGVSSWMSRGQTSGSSPSGQTAVSASYALTASYAANNATPATASYSNNSTQAANANTATSASYATVAQNVLGNIATATTASYATVAQNVLGSITNAATASLAATASYALNTARLNTVLVTGSYTASAQDSFIIVSANFASCSVYLPAAINIAGQQISVRKDDPTFNPVMILPNGSDTIDGASGRQLIVTTDSAVFISDGGSMWKSDGAASTITPDLLYDIGPNSSTANMVWLITRDTQKETLTGNATTTISNIPAGGYLIAEVYNDSVGNHTHAFLQSGMGSLVWDQGATPTQTTTPFKMDRYVFYNSGTRVVGSRVWTSV